MIVIVVALVASGCGAAVPAPRPSAPLTTATPTPAVTSSGPPVRHPVPAATEFVVGVRHPFLPLVPGSRWVYEESSSEGRSTVVVTVTHRARTVAGIRAVVVHDRVAGSDRALLEDTYDWYAQDRAGNVWYLGEDTTAYDAGKRSKAGSWEHGRNGAIAGIALPAEPAVGMTYYQEFLRGTAEDAGRIVALDARVRVPYGSFAGLVETADFTALEPAVLEHKYYARGVGVVYEETVRGGDERVRLISYTKP
jgi:hypothetical protein